MGTFIFSNPKLKGIGIPSCYEIELNNINYASPRFAADKKTIQRIIEYGAYTVEPYHKAYKTMRKYNKELITPCGIDKIGCL